MSAPVTHLGAPVTRLGAPLHVHVRAGTHFERARNSLGRARNSFERPPARTRACRNARNRTETNRNSAHVSRSGKPRFSAPETRSGRSRNSFGRPRISLWALP